MCHFWSKSPFFFCYRKVCVFTDESTAEQTMFLAQKPGHPFLSRFPLKAVVLTGHTRVVGRGTGPFLMAVPRRIKQAAVFSPLLAPDLKVLRSQVSLLRVCFPVERLSCPLLVDIAVPYLAPAPIPGTD